jgi:hypothetical protein
MQKEQNTLKEAWYSLVGLIKEVSSAFPFMVMFFGFLLYKGYKLFTGTANSTVFILCLIVGVLSIGVYAKNKSFFETMIAFLLGILTIFSITWDTEKAIIVGSMFFGFFILFSALSAVRLSSEIETILTHASNFMQSGNQKDNFKVLNEIVKQKSKYGQLHIEDRAKAVRFFIFIKVPINDLKASLDIIEILKTVYQISLEESLNFYRSIFILDKRGNYNNVSTLGLELIFSRITQLPLVPQEFFQIFNLSKKSIYNKYNSIFEYLDEMESLLEQGLDIDSIVEKLK